MAYEERYGTRDCTIRPLEREAYSGLAARDSRVNILWPAIVLDDSQAPRSGFHVRWPAALQVSVALSSEVGKAERS